MQINNDTPVVMLTLGQLKDELLSSLHLPESGQSENQAKNTRYVYGMGGLAQLFNCSLPTANRIKASGKINGAVKQIGRKIIIDADLAIELAGRKEGRA